MSSPVEYSPPSPRIAGRGQRAERLAREPGPLRVAGELHQGVGAGAVLEPRERAERLLPYGLVVVLVARDGNERVSDLANAALARIQRPREPGDGGPARLASRVLVAGDGEESRRDLHAIRERRGEHGVPADASVGPLGEAEEIVGRIARPDPSEVGDTGLRLRHRAGERGDRDHLAARAIQDDANRPRDARLAALGIAPVAVPGVAGDLNERAAVSTDFGAGGVGELHARLIGVGDPVRERLGQGRGARQRQHDQREGEGSVRHCSMISRMNCLARSLLLRERSEIA